MRRRTAAMVLDAPSDPGTWPPLVDAMRTTSYVVAPVMPSGKIIGFFQADCYLQGREVDEHDRDVLWAFTEGFGYALVNQPMPVLPGTDPFAIPRFYAPDLGGEEFHAWLRAIVD